jgi:transglutaminase-like putative cysteine protease
MLISFGFEIALGLESEATVLFCLKVHRSRFGDLLSPEQFEIEPRYHLDEFLDHFGNRCGRVHCKPGTIRFTNRGMIRDSGELDPFVPRAQEEGIFRLPADALVFLLPSRYCESDSELASFAWEKFGPTQTGWDRVQAICDFVHHHVEFDYGKAKSSRTALETFRERIGVCRDFTHLAITLCRCMNIPARLSPVILAISVFPRRRIRWTLALGWRFFSVGDGFRSIHATIAEGSGAS